MNKILQIAVDLAIVVSASATLVIASKTTLSPFQTFVVYPAILLAIGTVGYFLHQVVAKAPDRQHLFEQLLKELHIQEFVHKHIHH